MNRLLLVLLLLSGCAFTPKPELNHRSSFILVDDERQRNIPIEIYPSSKPQCRTRDKVCPLAIISPGYGVSHKEYSFLAKSLNQLGYLVITVQHELPSDPPLATSGDLYTLRSSNWKKGAENIRFVIRTLSKYHNDYDWSHLLLVGHSNGGDISAWIMRESPDYADIVVTLDHRRVPLPREYSTKVLSIRAGDFPADDGVLPDEVEQQKFGACIVKIPNARHNDMYDGGSVELKNGIVQVLEAFLRDIICMKEMPNKKLEQH